MEPGSSPTGGGAGPVPAPAAGQGKGLEVEVVLQDTGWRRLLPGAEAGPAGQGERKGKKDRDGAGK